MIPLLLLSNSWLDAIRAAGFNEIREKTYLPLSLNEFNVISVTIVIENGTYPNRNYTVNRQTPGFAV